MLFFYDQNVIGAQIFADLHQNYSRPTHIIGLPVSLRDVFVLVSCEFAYIVAWSGAGSLTGPNINR